MKNVLFVLIFMSCSLYAQNNQSNLKIYLNCNYCDATYIKQNLNYVEFVRDQNFADVQLLFRTQRNGGGGTKYEIEFIGQNNYKDVQDKITFSTKADNTRNETRELIFEHIKIGLVRYWIKNGDQDKIGITLKKEKTEVDKEVSDPWNKWVFNLGVNGYMNGQESNKSRHLSFNISAKQVTEKNKFYLRVRLSDNRSSFTYEDEEIISNTKSKSAYLSDVISINDHWSVGFFSNAGESTYRNQAFYMSFKPAVEYNFFNYEDSSKKGLVLSYRVGGVHHNYVEKTIFNKKREFLWEHSLSLGGTVKQKWGTINGDLTYESYLHDPSLKAISFYLGTNLRLFKGFSLNLGGNYEITDNQINLAAGDLSLEELLLRQQQVKSGYNYFFNMGISYSFGSIFNTIVNPRFNF